MTRRARPLAGAVLSALALAGAGASAAAATEPPPGEICIAAFAVRTLAPGEAFVSGPLMSQTTWEPGADSVFEFRFGERAAIAARNHEMVAVADLPVDRKVKVAVRLDGEPFETFWLDLGRAPGNRICLWLYPGYWHWIDNGWSPELGCKCGEEVSRGSR